MNGSAKIPMGLKGPSHKVSEGTLRNISLHTLLCTSLMKDEKVALTLSLYINKFFLVLERPVRNTYCGPYIGR